MKFNIFAVVLLAGNGLFSDEKDVAYFPQWQELECQAGHKYLFNTDQTHTWEDAIAECQLYGGWLLDVTGLEEYNCLMRYGNSQGFDAWFWTDANDQASKGVWVHASTDSDLTWINPKWSCGWEDGHFGSPGGDAMVMNFGADKKMNGAWCESFSSTRSYHSICKAKISNGN